MILLKVRLDEERQKFEAEAPAALAEAIRTSVVAISDSELAKSTLKAEDYAFGFRLPDLLRLLYAKVDLQSMADRLLPVSVTYVIYQSGRIPLPTSSRI